MRAEKLPDPVFSNNSGGFEVILNGPGKGFDKVIDDIKLHKLDLNERQTKAMEHIKARGSISRREYIDINHISHTIAHKELKELLGKKVLVTIGAGKYLRYGLTQG